MNKYLINDAISAVDKAIYDLTMLVLDQGIDKVIKVSPFEVEFPEKLIFWIANKDFGFKLDCKLFRRGWVINDKKLKEKALRRFKKMFAIAPSKEIDPVHIYNFWKVYKEGRDNPINL